MKICIDNSNPEIANDKKHKDGYTALCQEHKHASYGVLSSR